MSIRGRLQRLEQTASGGRCPECRLTPQERGYIVIADECGEEPQQEFCPRCGRGLYLIIEVVYEGEGEDGR